MSSIDRRHFLKFAGATSVAAALPFPISKSASALPLAAPSPHPQTDIVIIGGGYAGATAAGYFMKWSGLTVTLIEPNATYIAGPASNLVLASEPPSISIPSKLIGHYNNLPSGVKRIQKKATAVDLVNNEVTLDDNSTVIFGKKLIFAPGISFTAPLNVLPDFTTDFNPVNPSGSAPHAWIPGALTSTPKPGGGFYNQLQLLKSQLNAMPSGGTVVISIPKAARAPAAAYSRVCIIYQFLKTYKGNAKLIVLDANNNGTVTAPPGTPARQTGLQGEVAIFDAAFRGFDPNNFTYYWGVNFQTLNIAGKSITGSAMGDLSGAYVTPIWFPEIKNWNVLNYIPDQQAGAKNLITAAVTALGSHYVPPTGAFLSVNPLNYQLKDGSATPLPIPNVHILGDSNSSGQAKGGHMANAQAKVCVDAIVRSLSSQDPNPLPTTVTTGFNPITAKTASFATYIYHIENGAMVRKEYNSLSPTQLSVLNTTSVPYKLSQFGVPTAPSTTIFEDMNEWVDTLNRDSAIS